MVRMLKDFWASRKLIWKLARNDFKTRYAGSYFGVLWAMVQPVIIVLVYWFVFQIGLNNATAELKQGISVPFVLWLVSGIVPWFYFSESLSNGTNALLEYNYLVKKVVFNIDILPLVKTIAALFIHVFFVLFMLFLFALYGYYPGLHTLWVVYFSACLLIFVTGVCMLTSSLVIFFRDLTQIINIFLQGRYLDDTDYVEPGRFACKISDSYGAEAESPLLYRLWLSCGTVSDRFCGKPWLDEYLFLGSDHSGMAAGKSCVPETESAFCRRTVKENYEQRSN